jgi:hypothetical protein
MGFYGPWGGYRSRGGVEVFGALYHTLGISVATEFTFEELLAVVIKSLIMDVLVVAFVILEGFLRQYFCVLFCVQKVVVEGALEEKGSLHYGGAKVLVCSSDRAFSVFFELVQLLDCPRINVVVMLIVV